MKIRKINLSLLYSVLLITTSVGMVSCKKMVQIPPPNNSITTAQVFADSADAANAISGIYASILNAGGLGFCNGAQTIYCGLSADELSPVNPDAGQLDLFNNTLNPMNGELYGQIWQNAYFYIYETNACIEGLQNSKSLSAKQKSQFIAEAKFMRSLFYFYLINLYGDVPYVKSTAYAQTDTIGRTDKMLIYQHIISDLKSAKTMLPSDYSFSGGNRTRVNKFGAAALLARVYLFSKDWTNAKAEADSIINSSLYSMVPDLNSVFLANSQESILQWQLNTSFYYGTSTNEGYTILPSDTTQPPAYFIIPKLLNAFDPLDNRRKDWISYSTSDGVTYAYPYKYKRGSSDQNIGGSPVEYYTVFRLAEQYLIRAEAEANGATGGINAAIADLNMIRNRAGLPNYAGATDETSILNAIMHERQIELFAEWGNRWLDLKRTGKVDGVMSIVTQQKNPGGQWQSYQQLYPIPLKEITLNHYLNQNPGYPH